MQQTAIPHWHVVAGSFTVGGRMSGASPASANTSRPVASREVTVLNRQGIHARPSAAFVKLAAQFRSDVFLEKDGETINGKSIMGLLMLAAGPGSKLRIVCQGEDAQAALDRLAELVNSRFGEA
jgi:phosphocarrier protein HPr